MNTRFWIKVSFEWFVKGLMIFLWFLKGSMSFGRYVNRLVSCTGTDVICMIVKWTFVICARYVKILPSFLLYVKGLVSFVCVMGLLSFVCVTGQVLFVCVMGQVSLVCVKGLVSLVCVMGQVLLVCVMGLVSLVCVKGLLVICMIRKRTSVMCLICQGTKVISIIFCTRICGIWWIWKRTESFI